MNIGQKVTWEDLVTGRTRYGVLIERNHIYAESKADSELRPTEIKDVDYWEWDVEEEKTGKTFCLKEEYLQVVFLN